MIRLIEAWKEFDGQGHEFFLARYPSITGCMAQGDSIEEAIESLHEVKAMCLDALKRAKLPEPPSDVTVSSFAGSTVLLSDPVLHLPDRRYE